MTRSFGLVRMGPRDPHEPNRTASPLELLFDLVFVVAVSVSSAALAEVEISGDLGAAATGYLMVFFGVWWAWVNFTWFANSFDTDDWLYRVMTVVQMGGALVLAAGARPAMLEGDFTWAVVGYIIMRLITVPQWIRAAAANRAFRGTAARYVVGITALQVLWVLLLFVPQPARTPMFVTLVLLEVLVPVVAERHNPTPWHAHHLTERYSLFTIILLGESILASSNAVFAAIEGHDSVAPFIVVAVLSLVVIASMWWVYFAQPMHDRFANLRSAMTFGYFHYVIFAAAGAFSAGVEVSVAMAEGQADLGEVGARATLAVPVGLFFLGVWWLALRRRLPGWANAAVVVLGFVIAGSVLVPFSLGLIAVCTVSIVAIVHSTSERAT